MKPGSILFLLACLLLSFSYAGSEPRRASRKYYLGFDRNNYPGDEQMKDLRKMFAFSGYWLNNPPGTTSTDWKGKRKYVQSLGYGFLVLFRGRTFSELKDLPDPAVAGIEDALAAIDAAKDEGFPPRTIIFLDLEEGGRLLDPQRRYLHAWVDLVNRSRYRSGVYSSGVPAGEASGNSVVTAADIKKHAGKRAMHFWISNHACPPSPGCVVGRRPPPPSDSGIKFASVWQFAQSPKQIPISSGCGDGYRPDGYCYPPGMDVFIDLNVANSPDPSHGIARSRSTRPEP